MAGDVTIGRQVCSPIFIRDLHKGQAFANAFCMWLDTLTKSARLFLHSQHGSDEEQFFIPCMILSAFQSQQKNA